MVLAVPVDARPGDVAMEDVDEALIARVPCADTPVGVSQDSRYKLRWNEGLQDGCLGWTIPSLPEKNIALDGQTAEVLPIEGVGELPGWLCASADHFLDLTDGVVRTLSFGEFVSFVVDRDEFDCGDSISIIHTEESVLPYFRRHEACIMG